ncbi:NUDIX hydrolase [Deinococcus sp. KNUC1210]|uniref:NUDIX hydrolase n=1 Tax=Deinococcus sp. KNUC1210 TaxID=2917691 RepID=UPI001EF101D1|nr:NUDIX hydrolase [Deinococcus sp. KNUC1210]ULH14497.1 NUDIX hydrolase [Deinococcus sp. KNUC1210]
MSDEQKQATGSAAGRRRRRKRGSGPRPATNAQATSGQPLSSAGQPEKQASAPTGSQGGAAQQGSNPQRRGRQPAPKRPPKKPPAEPRIGVGCIVLRGDEILMVREKGRWSLPKGGLDAGELVQQGAIRETYEETGLNVELRELAFVVEFQAKTWGHHLQFFYLGREVGGTLGPRDPDREVQEAKFIPLRLLREYLRFRPRLVALETWLRERRPRHFVFDLDREPAMLRTRRRVGEKDVVVSE